MPFSPLTEEHGHLVRFLLLPGSQAHSLTNGTPAMPGRQWQLSWICPSNWLTGPQGRVRRAGVLTAAIFLFYDFSFFTFGLMCLRLSLATHC